MANLDEKFDKFTEVTLKTAARRRDQLVSEVQAVKQQKLGELENTYLEKAYKTIQRGVTNAQKAAAEHISLVMADSRREVLQYREDLIERLFSDLEQKLAAFKESEAYSAFLEKMVTDGITAVGGGEVQVVLDVSDKGSAAQLRSKFGIEPTYQPGLLGGAIVISDVHKKICHHTLRARIDEAREEFLEWSGFSIYQGTGDAV
mgnify:FL=1